MYEFKGLKEQTILIHDNFTEYDAKNLSLLSCVRHIAMFFRYDFYKQIFLQIITRIIQKGGIGHDIRTINET